MTPETITAKSTTLRDHDNSPAISTYAMKQSGAKSTLQDEPNCMHKGSCTQFQTCKHKLLVVQSD